MSDVRASPGGDREVSVLHGPRGTVRVEPAEPRDIEPWMVLAAEVEHLFGPMIEEPEFERSVSRAIARGTALCARVGDMAMDRLAGALLFSGGPDPYAIHWLAVAEGHRRRGIGRFLVERACRRSPAYPCTVEVVTFGADHAGSSARRFYERLGFVAAEIVANGPDGGSRQVYRLQRGARHGPVADPPLERT
ncbi:MAG: GNAT family N-acetyltransferase [Acidimicrobiales bacterium]